MDLGAPASYLTLEDGAEVYSSDGQPVGRVAHVLAAEEKDIFDGIVLETRVGGGGHRFIDASHVEEIFARGVVLRLDAATCESLPEPSENPAALAAGPDDTVGGTTEELRAKLRRAWELISGKY